MEKIEFYNKFMANLWQRDLKFVNYRIEEIKKLINRFVPKHSRILEIGCGNGLVTKHLVRQAKNVLAVDISPIALANAKRYVNNNNCRFMTKDDFDESFYLCSFDAVILADVIEHTEGNERLGLIQMVEKSLVFDGIAILTWPHPKTQEHDPQIIEEPVDIMGILALTNLKLFYFSYVDVDSKNKYIHCVLKKHIPCIPIKRSFVFRLLNIVKKIKHRLFNLRLNLIKK